MGGRIAALTVISNSLRASHAARRSKNFLRASGFSEAQATLQWPA